jgi:Zinc carboxypeptidase
MHLIRPLICAVTLASNLTMFAAAQVQAKPAQPPATTPSLLEDAFHTGLLLRDTNGDSIADAVCAHIVVPDSPNEGENTAAANLAARLGYETSGITLPIVTTAAGGATFHAQCSPEATSLWVGRGAVPTAQASELDVMLAQLQLGEGGIFSLGNGLAFVGADSLGLLTATNAYAARAPYQWSLPGPKLQELAEALNAKLVAAKLSAHAELIGLTYFNGKPGIQRAILRVTGSADAVAIRKALSPSPDATMSVTTAANVWQIVLPNGAPLVIPTGGAAPRVLPAIPDTPAEDVRLLDLGQLYTFKGLLSGSPKKMVPSSVAARLYVGAREPGVAMANLAARLAFESVGVTLPLAFPASGVTAAQAAGIPVVGDGSLLADHERNLLGAPGGTDLEKILPGQYSHAQATELGALQTGEGELRVIDRAFGKSPALLVRGDAQGQAAALLYGSEHLPYLWEPSKKYESTNEMRLDVQRFFSLRSSAGQASAALYHLDTWASELAASSQGKTLGSVRAEVDVDEADPKLKQFIHDQLAQKLHTANIEVVTGTLHAGTKCCDSDPPLHNNSSLIPFQQHEPTFSEDLTIPWEGKRLLDAVQAACSKIEKQSPVVVQARVSEGPEMRNKLRDQIVAELKSAGADPKQMDVHVLSAYKQGYSWLVDEIAPELKDKHVAKMKIEFAPYQDAEKLSSMGAISRWGEELFPVDEVLARDLKTPLENIELAQKSDASGATYTVHAWNAGGAEVLKKDFSVKTVTRPYSNQFPHYETVNVTTGWLSVTSGSNTLADARIETDPEYFWEHYQTETLPRIFKLIVQQNDGKPKIEFQPLFDTLKISFKMSEPDYEIGIDQERISSLEALQEDTFFSTQNFFFMMGDMMSTGKMDYQGRVLPVSYPSVEGQDGHVRIEYYAKDAGFPQVNLSWKIDGDPIAHEKTRELPALKAGDARLVAARLGAGDEAVHALTWRIAADYNKDNYDQWITEQEKETVEHSILSVQQASAQIDWLGRMHGAGIYSDTFAYAHLKNLAFEFELPLEPGTGVHTKNEIMPVQYAVTAPAKSRPQITDFTPEPVDGGGHFVSWDNPIDPAHSEHLLSRLATYPGVNVYWMGKTYLGRDMWAADVMLPSPSELRSLAKETTLKAVIIYSGRQHANEVSSTSHLFRLAEQLVTDPTTRDSLKKVNVVIHPITNVDGAQLSIDLAHITPNFMLHPGYHASLTADLTDAQWDPNPVYPESATRRLLWQAWLPDAFLNPHGYPTHEWVQPFSEYAAWVITRTEAEYGRNNWVPRGWFTSLFYLGDEEHKDTKTVSYALRDLIVDNMAKTPGVLALNKSMNDRYARFQRFDVYGYQQPIYKGTRIYMALKGEHPSSESDALNSFMLRYPDITYDDGYTEAPDETAYGSFLHLVASAGLAFDHAHLEYFNQGKYKITRTQKDFFDGVQWSVDRDRPVLPPNMSDSSAEPASPAEAAKAQ